MKLFISFASCLLLATALADVTVANGGTLNLSDPLAANGGAATSSVVFNPNFGTSVIRAGMGALNLTDVNFTGVSPTYLVGAGTIFNVNVGNKAPALTGKAGDLHITANSDGGTLKIKTTVAITNVGTATAKNVLATVYLSDDATLDPADTQLAVLKLADYVPGATKLRKGETLSIPIKRKVPTAVASFLEGKYLIAVLTANKPGSTAGTSTDANLSSATVTGILRTGTLADLTLTAKVASTFNTTLPTSGKPYQTDAIVPTGNLKVATTGEIFTLLSGEEIQVQPGDELIVSVGTSLHAVTENAWNLSGGGTLDLKAGATAQFSQTATDSIITITTPASTASVPANEVIIGPIHLP